MEPVTKEDLIAGVLKMFGAGVLNIDLTLHQIKQFATDERVDWKQLLALCRSVPADVPVPIKRRKKLSKFSIGVDKTENKIMQKKPTSPYLEELVSLEDEIYFERDSYLPELNLEEYAGN